MELEVEWATTEDESLRIESGPSNYYGGILLREKKDGTLWWGIEDYNHTLWHSCPRYLYDALVRYEKEEQGRGHLT